MEHGGSGGGGLEGAGVWVLGWWPETEERGRGQLRGKSGIQEGECMK